MRMLLRDASGDAWYTLRMLWRTPGFALVAVATLGIGIGATTAIFSVIHGVLLRPLPYPDADRLMQIVDPGVTAAQTSRGMRPVRPGIAVLEFLELRERARTLSHVGQCLPVARTMVADGDTARLEGARISPALLPILGGTPQLGRVFTVDEERAGADAVVVLSDAIWQGRFSRDPRIIGRMVSLDGRGHEIVGVMPPGFAFPNASTTFWVPLVLPTSGPASLSRYMALAQVKAGVSVETATAEVNALLHSIRAEAEGRPQPSSTHSASAPVPDARVTLVSLQEQLVAPVRPALIVLGGAAGLVLLIACANFANLLLARTTARQREFAVRFALGSGHGRLVRQLLAESLTISLLGGLIGVAVAFGAVRLLRVLSTGLARTDLGPAVALPRLDEVAIDPTALGFALVAVVITGVTVGLVPILSHIRLQRGRAGFSDGGRLAALRGGGSAAIGGFDLLHRHRARAVLIVVEISMATMLLVCGALMARSLMNLVHVDPGYDADSVLTFTVPRPAETPTENATDRQRVFADSLVDRLKALPGLTAAGYAGTLPMVSFQGVAALRLTPDEVPQAPAASGPFDTPPPDFPNVQRVSRDFLTVMGIPVREGRAFEARDVAGAPRVLLINQALARSRYLGERPIGRHVYLEDATPWEIIGVVDDVRQVGLDREAGPQIFMDLRQAPGAMTDRVYFALRQAAGADISGATIATVRETVRALDARASIDTVATMEQIVSHSVAKQRLYATMLALFAAVAVLLASVGVFAIVAYGVAQRTREIGVRMALGASRSAVLWLVLGQSVWLIGEGLAAGLLGAVGATRLLGRWLYELTPLDVPTFLASGLLFAAVATIAAWLPARRALKVNPLIALRGE